MTIQSVDAKGGNEKTQLERSRNLGDPKKDDEDADAANDIRANRPPREGRHGKGVTPIEGTSASNIAVSESRGRTCGNPYTGYGTCGGEIDEVAECCKKCGIPVKERAEAAMAAIRTGDFTPNGNIVAGSEDGGGSAVPAHMREAYRLTVTREEAAVLYAERNWDPDALGQYGTVPPMIKKQAAEIQAELDRRCQVRFRAAGLEPRRAD